jgi:hypothetical protein
VYSLVLATYPDYQFGFFEVGKVGGPCTVAGWFFFYYYSSLQSFYHLIFKQQQLGFTC